jgi:hypothetical protein
VSKKVLVIDVGGNHVKLMVSPDRKRKFKSDRRMTPAKMIAEVKQSVNGWSFDLVSIGFPAPVKNGRIATDPKNLGKGWVAFNFRKAFGKPVRVVNDAAMQALGSYHGGRMLFLGLGTGLGSTLIWENNVLPLELGDLPYRDHRVIEDFLGRAGMDEFGEKEWRCEVIRAVAQLKKSVIADYVVVGGGNVKKLDKLPAGVERGYNRNAFLGGTRLWQMNSRTKTPKWRIM